jgi:2',3'-cyclic-nucleotide 2'-phosphodiesterase/3'-nucleotidase
MTAEAPLAEILAAGPGGFVHEAAPLAPDRKLRLAINNYRFNGGGYTMFKNAKVLARSSAEIRDLIIAWVERHHAIPAEPIGNWRLLP